MQPPAMGWPASWWERKSIPGRRRREPQRGRHPGGAPGASMGTCVGTGVYRGPEDPLPHRHGEERAGGREARIGAGDLNHEATGTDSDVHNVAPP